MATVKGAAGFEHPFRLEVALQLFGFRSPSDPAHQFHGLDGVLARDPAYFADKIFGLRRAAQIDRVNATIRHIDTADAVFCNNIIFIFVFGVFFCRLEQT